MKVSIQELKDGYIFEYNHGVNDVRVAFEERGKEYVFLQLYDNFNVHTGEGGPKTKEILRVYKKDITDPKEKSLELLKNVLKKEVFSEDKNLEFKIVNAVS